MFVKQKENFKWIDETIELNFKIPTWWEEQFRALEQMDIEGNELYLVLAADMEDMMHEDVISGNLTSNQVKEIILKYYGPKAISWEKKHYCNEKEDKDE